jgi:hypothetical protein
MRDDNRKTDCNPKPSGAFGEILVYSRTSDREVGREAVRSPEELKTALDRLLCQQASETDLVAYLVPSSTSFHRIATADWGRAFVQSDLEAYVAEELSCRLSPEDYRLFGERALDITDVIVRRRIHEALDEVIMQGALDKGPIIFLLPAILQRVSDWALDAADQGRRWRQLGKQFALIGPVMRGKKAAPLDAWVRPHRAILQEVKALRRVLREGFDKSRTLPQERVLLDAAVDAVEASPGIFPTLARIGDSFQLFLGAQPLALCNLLTEKITPAIFRNELIGWITNRDPEGARQMISKISQ